MSMKAETKKITKAALLAAIAVIIFVIEAQLPPLTSIPGIKMGLSNVITILAVYALSPLYALAILLVRIVLGGLITGQVMAIAYSLAGGLAALFVCIILRQFIAASQMWAVSAVSAVFHNAGQIAAAVVITGTPAIVSYLPALIISGIIAGIFTGLCAQFAYSQLQRLGFF